MVRLRADITFNPLILPFLSSCSLSFTFVPFTTTTTAAMGAIEILSLALTHPNDFRILLQFWNFYLPKRDITKKEEHPSSGWDRPTMRRCWELLDHSSRSFSAVIKELDGDLARVVSLSSLSSLPPHTLVRLGRKTSRCTCGLPLVLTNICSFVPRCGR